MSYPNQPGQPYVPPPGAPGGPPQYGSPAAPPPAYGAPVADAEQRQWAMFAHFSGILFSLFGPLVIWAMYKDKAPFVKDQAQEALNFQILIAIIGLGATIVLSILILFGGLLLMPLLGLLWVAVVVFAVLGGMAANKGETYRYPFNLRLVK